MKFKSYIIVWVVFILAGAMSTPLQAGGGWPQKKGKGYFKLSEWWILSDQHYTDAGLIDPNITTGIYNTTFYGEYGLTDRFTIVVNAPLFSRALIYNQISQTTGETILAGDAINSIGDLDIAIKFGLTKPGSNIAVSSTMLFGLPLGIESGGVNGNLQTGDGEFNQMVQLDAGFSLFNSDKISVYGNIYSGFNNRTNDFSDEVRYGAEIGAGVFSQKLWLTAKWNGLSSLKNGTLSSDINSTSIFANNTEFQSILFGASVFVTKKVGFTADFATAVAGNIILASPSYSVGVFLQI